jgi:DNA-directed RNA polymerase specialized sigma24 family protein
LAVSQDLGKFDHGGQPGAFRGWLKAILVNRLRKFWRARDRRPRLGGGSDIDARLAQLDDPASKMSQIWDRQHDQYVLRQLLALAEPNFTPGTWRAFCRVALDGVRPDLVAKELDISLNAVCLAKSRVLRRLRGLTEKVEPASGVAGVEIRGTSIEPPGRHILGFRCARPQPPLSGRSQFVSHAFLSGRACGCGGLAFPPRDQ